MMSIWAGLHIWIQTERGGLASNHRQGSAALSSVIFIHTPALSRPQKQNGLGKKLISVVGWGLVVLKQRGTVSLALFFLAWFAVPGHIPKGMWPDLLPSHRCTDQLEHPNSRCTVISQQMCSLSQDIVIVSAPAFPTLHNCSTRQCKCHHVSYFFLHIG